MPVTPPPTITPLPDFPVRGEDQTTFATKANATVAAYPTMVEETNALAEWTEDTAADVEANAIEAGEAKDDAEAALTQTVAIAGTYTVINQGAHATPPTTRNDGSPLQTGDLYYDTVAGRMKIWS